MSIISAAKESNLWTPPKRAQELIIIISAANNEFICQSTYKDINLNSLYSLKISEGALVCEESILKGDITIGPRTVIHPRASIIAEAGPIIIGEGNIIEEMATIANKLPADAPESATVPVQIIGNYNVFETDCTCQAFKVGNNNILESKAYVAREVELTNGCVIGASCSVTESEVIPENTIIYGSQCQRREMYDKPYPQMGQLEFLMKVLPNYHHLRKPNIKPTKSEGGV